MKLQFNGGQERSS